MRYYLADEIYPNWSTFVKTIPRPLGAERKYFASKQESARKDVEQAFGVLQSHFAIVRGPVRYWDEETLAYIMKACIIMHNMIIKDEGVMNSGFDHEHEVNSFISVSHGEIPELHDFFQTHNRIRDRATSSQLQEDLIEHLRNNMATSKIFRFELLMLLSHPPESSTSRRPNPRSRD